MITLIIVLYLLVGVGFTCNYMRHFRNVAEEQSLTHRLSQEQWVHTWIQASVLVVAWPFWAGSKLLVKLSPSFACWMDSRIDHWTAKPRPDGPSRWQRTATRLTHYDPLAVAAVFAAALVSEIVGYWWGVVIYWTAFALFMVVSAATLHHSFLLCPRCASATPLDGPGTAAKRSRTLRLYHWSRTRRSILGFAVGLVFAPVAAALLHIPYGAAALPLYVYMAMQSVAGLRHRPLQPWCPQCHWGDEGDDHETPVPPPIPTEQATR